MNQPAELWGYLYRPEAERYVFVTLIAGTCYAAGVVLVRGPARLPRWGVKAILGIGLVARLMVLAVPPQVSTDVYRYVWDGRVQAAGINPYRYIPADPALARLRDERPGATAIYPNINRRETAPTIYPPAAQLLFAAVGQVWPSLYGMKAAMLLMDLVATGALLLLLRAAGRPAGQILIWAWNPLVIWEFAGAGHIDAASCAFIALALLAAARGRGGWAGAAIGGAVLFKLLPAALFPALWRARSRGWDWRVPAAAGAVILGGYALYASAGMRCSGSWGGTRRRRAWAGTGRC